MAERVLYFCVSANVFHHVVRLCWLSLPQSLVLGKLCTGTASCCWKLLVGASCIRARRSSCITDPSISFYSIYMYICLPLIIRSRRQNGDSRSAQFLRSSYSGLQHSIMYHSTRHWAQAATLLLQRNDRVGPACISASHAGAPPLPHPGGHLADTTDVC